MDLKNKECDTSVFYDTLKQELKHQNIYPEDYCYGISIDCNF